MKSIDIDKATIGRWFGILCLLAGSFVFIYGIIVLCVLLWGANIPVELQVLGQAVVVCGIAGFISSVVHEW